MNETDEKLTPYALRITVSQKRYLRKRRDASKWIRKLLSIAIARDCRDRNQKAAKP